MRLVSRRDALAFVGGSFLAGVATRVTDASATWCAPPGPQDWSTLGYSGHVTISGTVVLDVSASVSSLTVPAGARLIFHPDRDIVLESSGNVTVAGTMEMEPGSVNEQHTLRFVGINETGYVGGGCDPAPSEVGLWVTGVLKTAGATKRGWTRSTTAIATGATSLVVEDAAGWQIGDRLVISPTGANFYDYTNTTVTSINGNTVGITAAQKAHPMSPPWNGTPLGAEVLNLTRNVVIEGQPGARAHILIHSPTPQTIRYAELRHLGPRRSTGQTWSQGTIFEPVLGRYALHFHSCQDGSRGSLVEGVAAHSLGSRAFVPHASHGITLRDCIGHDGFEAMYWWDSSDVSSDTTIDRCAASLVKCDPPFRGFRITGFDLKKGSGNRLLDSVAFGVQGNSQPSGVAWDEAGSGMWETRGVVVHNNSTNGFFVWQNTNSAHFISDCFIYRCPRGIEQGAYNNNFRYDRITISDCVYPVRAHALSNTQTNIAPQRFVDCVFTTNERGCVHLPQHDQPGLPVEFHRCTFNGGSIAAIYTARGQVFQPDKFDFIDCTFSGAKAVLGPDFTHPASALRFQNGAVASQLTLAGEAPIAPFFTGPLPAGAFVRGQEASYTYKCGIAS